MTDTFRALCAELVRTSELPGPTEFFELRRRARAALAQPEPVAPSKRELFGLLMQVGGATECVSISWLEPFANAVLARYGTAAIQPAPVSERLPKPGEWVWHCYAGVRFWQHGRYNGRQFFIGDGPESQPATHWLPANALPTPEAKP